MVDAACSLGLCLLAAIYKLQRKTDPRHVIENILHNLTVMGG